MSRLNGLKKFESENRIFIKIQDKNSASIMNPAREGVFAPGGHDCLAHTKQRFINIVGLTALRLAFLWDMNNTVVQRFSY